jgi:hypothetical protein
LSLGSSSVTDTGNKESTLPTQLMVDMAYPYKSEVSQELRLKDTPRQWRSDVPEGRQDYSDFYLVT